MLLLRSQFYNILMYLLILIMGIIFLIPALISRKGAIVGIHLFAKINSAMIRIICGIRVEVRGKIPNDTALICAKHMSFLDIVVLAGHLPEPRFIMKDSLRYVPVLSFYAKRIGSTPVKRGTGQNAVDKMIEDLDEESNSGQTVIYPQGTRTLPGQSLPYKRGAAALYQSFDLPAYMVATNIGVLWARKSPYRYPGLAIVEFLDDRIEPGLSTTEFMTRISTEIETESNRLMKDYPAYYSPITKK